MFTKILLTVGVIVAVALYLRARDAAEDDAGANSAPGSALGSTAGRAADSAAARKPTPANHKLTAIVLLALLGLGGIFFYLRWSEAQRLVTLRVVNSSSGEVIEYRAFANQLDGRTFVTADGRRITLADVERMELLGEID